MDVRVFLLEEKIDSITIQSNLTKFLPSAMYQESFCLTLEHLLFF